MVSPEKPFEDCHDSTSKGMAARAAGSCVFSASVGYLIYQKSPLVQLFGAAWEKNLDRKMGRQRPFTRTEQSGVPLEGHHGRSGVWGGGGGRAGQEKYLYSRGMGGGKAGNGRPAPFFDDGAGRWRARERETGPSAARPRSGKLCPRVRGNRGRRAGWG